MAKQNCYIEFIDTQIFVDILPKSETKTDHLKQILNYISVDSDSLSIDFNNFETEYVFVWHDIEYQIIKNDFNNFDLIFTPLYQKCRNIISKS